MRIENAGPTTISLPPEARGYRLHWQVELTFKRLKSVAR
jgi:hypothetical protein